MIRAVLTDIEGTTTSLYFVQQVLFPHAREHLAVFLHQRQGDPRVRTLLDEVRATAGLSDDAQLVPTLITWMVEDRKTTLLKELQGMIWAEGYRRGEFTGHVYPDAVSHLRAWHARGLRLFSFSSGSVAAQRLLFGHSDAGDLLPLFEGFFDTTVGAKREPASYRRIADAIGEVPAAMLFLSDVPAELDAGRSTGMHTVQLLREPGMVRGDHPTATTFAAIMPEALTGDTGRAAVP